MKKLLLSAAILSVIATGCYNDKYDKLYPAPVTTTCDTSAVSYAATIQPIFNTYCTSCHATGGTGISYGDMTSYNSTWTSSRNLSNMIRDINIASTSDINHMPQNTASLPACDINKITAWIHQGALNN